eukprot:125683-Rhodomonas_salina.1
MGAQVGSLTEAVSYHLRSVSTVMPSNAAVSSSSLTLSGASLGFHDVSGLVRIGGTACEATAWVSQSLIVCAASMGSSRSLSVGLTVASGAGSLTEALSYQEAKVSSVLFANSPVSSGTSITMIGSGLGMPAYSARHAIGRTVCEATEWISATATVCKGGNGLEASLQVSLTMGQQMGSMTEGLSFDGGWGRA